jgi:hypothetical protein
MPGMGPGAHEPEDRGAIPAGVIVVGANLELAGLSERWLAVALARAAKS